MKAPSLYRLPLFGLTALVAVHAFAAPCAAAPSRSSSKPAAPPTPVAVETAPVETKKPGFFSRIVDRSAAAVSRSAKAVSFWKKEDNKEAETPPAAPAPAPAPKVGQSKIKASEANKTAPKPVAVAKSRAKSAAQASPKLAARPSVPKPAPEAPPPAAEPKTEKRFGWGVMNKLAFWKRDAQPAEIAVPAPVSDAKPARETAKVAPAAKPSNTPNPGIAKKSTKDKIGPEKPSAVAQAKSKSKGKPEPTPVVVAQPEKKRGFFASLFGFGSSSAEKKPAATARPAKADPALARVEASRAAAMAKLTPDRFVVTKDETAFYAYGPGQIPPVDAYLSTGTLVTLVKRSWGWAEVRLPDGRTGMIDRSAIRQASVYDLAPDPTGPSRAMLAQMQRNNGRSAQPVVEILPALPMPELPGPDARPSVETLSASLLPPLEQ